MQPPPDAKLLQIRAKHFLGEVRVRNFKQTIQIIYGKPQPKTYLPSSTLYFIEQTPSFSKIIYGKPQPKTYLPSSTLILFAIEHEMAPSDKIL
jgi:hypothetical protein